MCANIEFLLNFYNFISAEQVQSLILLYYNEDLSYFYGFSKFIKVGLSALIAIVAKRSPRIHVNNQRHLK